MWDWMAVGGDPYYHDSNTILTSDGSREGRITGTSFRYDADGFANSGTWTKYSETAGSSTQFSVTGLSVPVSALAETETSNDVSIILFSGNDQFHGSTNGFSEYFIGFGGNDTFYGSTGNDTLDGGDGTDTVSYSGNRTAYTVSKGVDGAWHVQKPSAAGSDTLYNNIERLQFADGTLALDTGGTSGQMYRLYKAAFDRVPDAPGLGHNIRLMDNGLGIDYEGFGMRIYPAPESEKPR